MFDDQPHSLEGHRDRQNSVAELAAAVPEIGQEHVDAAAAFHLELTKPPGSLGRLETLGARLSAIAAMIPPPMPDPAWVVVFAADHGVHAAGVSPWPQEVTAQMVANFRSGGAAINAIAGVSGARLAVCDVGVATPHLGVPAPDDPEAAVRFFDHPVAAGTDNLASGPAMTPDQAASSILAGALTAGTLIAEGARCLVPGDMGIANTTPSAALIAAHVGAAANEMTGRGTGVDDETLALKTGIVAGALARHRARSLDELSPTERGIARLADLGGFEIGAIAGCCLAAAAARIPVVVDGVISLAGATIAATIAPHSVGAMFAGHRSTEPAATAALDALGLDPVLDLELRLGEGTGAALALPILRSAAAVMNEMATFADLGL